MGERASLNLATIRPATLEQKLYAASTAGFRAVGLLCDEMEALGEEGIIEVHLSELAVSELVGISGWMDLERSSRMKALERAEATFALAARVDCPVVVAWPSTERIDSLAASSDFQELCRMALPFGTKVALEFIGSSEDMNSVTAAWQLVERAGAENGGLVLDTFHFHRGGSTPDMLEPVPVEKIHLVQVSDCPDLPGYELEDGHRIYPGSGAIALEPVLAVLRGKGYAGYYSLELANEDYWDQDPMLVAREGLRSLQRLDIA